jgi:hypothetical protein
MPDALSTRRVVLGGLLRGLELEGEAAVALDADALSIDGARGRISLPLSELDGLRVPGDALELYLANGDVILLERSLEPNALASEIATLACAIPEMTRSLRVFGASGSASGVEHDRFFAPLLEARTIAERAPNLVALRAAFDAAALRASVAAVFEELAAERYPRAAGERRALAAELTDTAADLFVRIDALAAAQAALGACDSSERFLRWREWSAGLRDVFRAADGCWTAIHSSLGEERRERPSFWRRLFRRGARRADGRG